MYQSAAFPWGSPQGHPQEPRDIRRNFQIFVARGRGEKITFIHRDCTPGGRPWVFVGQRYSLWTIHRCCSRCSLRALVARDLGLELTKCRRYACLQLNAWTSDRKAKGKTIWSSGANCTTETQQTLNEGLSKANSWFLCGKFLHLCVKGNTGPYCRTQGAGDLSEFLCPIPKGRFDEV